MNRNQPRSRRRLQQGPRALPTLTTASGRHLALFPSAVLAFIVDHWDRFLLLRKPGQTGWEVVSGAMEAGETVPGAVQREVEEEAGPRFLVDYLGVLDTFTFEFDANHPPLISICCLLRHRGGDVEPGDDARDAEFKWWEISELDNIELVVPRSRWDLLTKAVELSRYLRDARVIEEEERDRFEFPP